ncbi:tail fiber assembly protein [Yersinia enterocolitica]|uniref:tail fiber assembly protein n=1 Tax=Yersinia enterocolitica TaxID=630 RepID=UPI0028612B11|nr:tail fiber assembly protein [Yersinia enterocolitica]EKN3588615.1 tail fiber assembly protein [Yersinia enterocolitica]EKN3768995.1 tail fiber assembly protein [Yersinia enterocolitica]EKN4083719.1 tail fiber assembly protein [Yersinia enterocolitica]ELI7915923.1 tail fiber assembly protein [Yersinia enterocolitica]
MKLLWSAKNNAFIPAEMVDEYKVAGWAIDDLIEASEDILPFYGKAPIGKIRGVSDDNMPVWADIPPPTAAQLAEIKAINIAQAKSDKTKLISDASNKIETLKDRIDAGQDKAAELKLWKAYRIALDDVDVSAAPDIEWPVAPE